LKTERLLFENGEGDRLVGVVYAPDREGAFPAILYVHGLMSGKSGQKFNGLLESFERRDFVLFSFDSYGIGESDGELAELTLSKRIDGVKSALNILRQHEKVEERRIRMVGSSFGGLASIFVAADEPNLQKLILIAPAVNLCYETPDELSEFRMLAEDARGYDPLGEAERITVPTLLVAAEKDEVIPLEYQERLAERIQNCRFVVIKDATHRFDAEEHFSEMLSAVVGFIEEV